MAISSTQMYRLQNLAPASTPTNFTYESEPRTDLNPSVIPDGVVLSGSAQEVLERAKSTYLPNPATFWEIPSDQATCKAQIPPSLRESDDNLVQRKIKGMGRVFARGSRALGDAAGREVAATIKNPLRMDPFLGPAVRSAEAVGIPAPRVSLPGQELAAKTAESAVRGVGEFGASTAEDLSYAVAHPDKTAKGLYTLADTAMATNPLTGPSLIALESLATGKSMPEVWSQKQQNMEAIKQGFANDFSETRARVGLPGAIVKTGLDIFGLPRAGAKGVVTAGRVADEALGAVPGGPMIRRGLDSVHPDPKRRATARAERDNFRTEKASRSTTGASTVGDLYEVRENFRKQGLEETLEIGGSEVTVRGLRTGREREILTRELEQVREKAGKETLDSVGELMITDHPGLSGGNAKARRVRGYFATRGDKDQSVILIKRDALGEGTVAHELGHALDASDPKMGVWVSDSFDSPFGIGGRKSHVSDYATTDPFEDWAETFREFVTDPKKLDRLGSGDGDLAKKIKFMRDYVRQRSGLE